MSKNRTLYKIMSIVCFLCVGSWIFWAQENKDDPVWGTELMVHVKRYQTLVIEMNDKERRQLAAQLLQVFGTLKALQ